MTFPEIKRFESAELDPVASFSSCDALLKRERLSRAKWAKALADSLVVIDKERGVFPKSCFGCLEHVAQCSANGCPVGLVRDELLRVTEADSK